MGFYLGGCESVHLDEDERVAGSTLLTAAGVVQTAVVDKFRLCSLHLAGMVMAGSSAVERMFRSTRSICSCSYRWAGLIVADSPEGTSTWTLLVVVADEQVGRQQVLPPADQSRQSELGMGSPVAAVELRCR